MVEKKTVAISAGVFVVLAAIGSLYFIDNPEITYTCDIDEQTIIGECFKLSAVNSYGLQTRCYYNESAPRRYKNCANGWNLYNGSENITGNPIDLDDEIIDVIEANTDLADKEYTKKSDALAEYDKATIERDKEIEIVLKSPKTIIYMTNVDGQVILDDEIYIYTVCFEYNYSTISYFNQGCIQVSENATLEEIDTAVIEYVDDRIRQDYPGESVYYVPVETKGRVITDGIE